MSEKPSKKELRTIKKGLLEYGANDLYADELIDLLASGEIEKASELLYYLLLMEEEVVMDDFSTFEVREKFYDHKIPRAKVEKSVRIQRILNLQKE